MQQLLVSHVGTWSKTSIGEINNNNYLLGEAIASYNSLDGDVALSCFIEDKKNFVFVFHVGGAHPARSPSRSHAFIVVPQWCSPT